MIVSVHIPKTAGTSFRMSLAQALGPRLLLDYGDWPEAQTPEARAHNVGRRQQALAQAAELAAAYDVIHGHCLATKYLGAFAPLNLVVFLRDPVEQTISAYGEALRGRNSAHPAIRAIREAGMGLVEFAEAYPNHQSLYLAGLGLDAFAMVGLTEHYARSIAIFRHLFGINVSGDVRINVHGDGQAGHRLDAPIRRAIERTREIDIAFYRRACERFAVEAARRAT